MNLAPTDSATSFAIPTVLDDGDDGHAYCKPRFNDLAHAFGFDPDLAIARGVPGTKYEDHACTNWLNENVPHTLMSFQHLNGLDPATRDELLTRTNAAGRPMSISCGEITLAQAIGMLRAANTTEGGSSQLSVTVSAVPA